MGKGLSIGEMGLIREVFGHSLEWEIARSLRSDRLGGRWNDCPICGGKACVETGDVFPSSTTLWYCWGDCSSGGDVFDLVARRDRISYEEAMRKLGERAGLWFTGEDPDPERGRALVQGALQDAQEFLASQADGCGEWPDALRSHLASLGIDEGARARWGVGCVPEKGALLGHLRARGYSPKTLLDSGLIDMGVRTKSWTNWSGEESAWGTQTRPGTGRGSCAAAACR